ncbi:MAG: hypothetical protein ABSC35_11990 [Candidatus Dormibacteria bacterium]|jgi:hypothetical protein
MAERPEEIGALGRARPAPRRRSRLVGTGMTLALSAVLLGVGNNLPAQAAAKTGPLVASKTGELDCNADSPAQKSVREMTCTDIKGILGVDNQNTWGGKFYDNGQYIGHDEPDATFESSKPGSGNDITWDETLGADPSAAPTDATPGTDVSHWFELTPAPWLSMALCDPNSYPQAPCKPNSDSNAPSATSNGGGSTFMEMQLYPPGEPPFVDSSGCDTTHWCAALTIDSLECTEGFATCNADCEEPVNFAFIQTNGVPTGAPSPQDANIATFTPNANTLLMNPGDDVVIHMADAAAPGGGKAFKVTIDDLTQHTSGWMQASAANGFANTSIANCSGTPFNFQPEYNTAKPGNIIPWAAIATDVSTEFETGHWESCTSLTKPLDPNPFDASDTGGTYNECHGPYETAGGKDKGSPEVGDGLCYKAGDTHPGYDGAGTSTAPDQATGCQDNYQQNGDLDFDGSPYWTEWPTGTTPGLYPSSFVDSYPTTGGSQYAQFFFQTDIALSEYECTSTTLSGCTVPPDGPGNFYPYWSEAKVNGQCVLEFGNVSSRVNTFGKDAQYGTNQFATLGYPEFIGKSHSTAC